MMLEGRGTCVPKRTGKGKACVSGQTTEKSAWRNGVSYKKERRLQIQEEED